MLLLRTAASDVLRHCAGQIIVNQTRGTDKIGICKERLMRTHDSTLGQFVGDWKALAFSA